MLLSFPINVHALRALVDGPRSLLDLRREAGLAPQTTMRGHLRTLADTGVLTRRRQPDSPGSLDFELTPAGRDLWAVARILQQWLDTAPTGPLQVGAGDAKSAVKALVEGWGTSMVRALAAKPFSLTELSGLIPGVSYPSLERRLGAMRLAGLIAATPSRGRGTHYAVTEWLRHGVAPLAAAARWERVHAPGSTPPITRLDAEAAFLLTIPLIEPPGDMSGATRLAVEVPSAKGKGLAGVLVAVEEGRIASCTVNLQDHADAWASGSAADWLRAVISQDRGRLELGGDCALAHALIDGLHGTLFGVRQCN